MEFLLILGSLRDAPFDESVFPEMGRFAGELAAKGRIRGGSPLCSESEGVRVRRSDGKAVVSDGPFAETREVIGGYFLIEAGSLREAVAVAKRCPHLANGFVEVRQVMAVGGPGGGGGRRVTPKRAPARRASRSRPSARASRRR